ncbi:hypothetical protein APF79_08130 [bacterium BRH_c32]|nr:MAG: hypothetical protein APF79_08130 [bacterium BRH_c32]
MKNLPYKYVALFYSHLMESIDYSVWGEYLIDLIEWEGIKHPSILELSSGLGNLSLVLSKRFRKIICSDNSLDMLLNFKNQKTPKICFDMKAIPLKKEFDIVLSTFDSINYLLTYKELVKHLMSVKNCLSKKGFYTFDASLELNSVKYSKLLNRKGEFENIKYRQRSFYDIEKKIHTNKFEITLPDGKSIQENHRQKIYPIEAFFKAADESGLYVQDCFNCFTFDSVNKKSERAQFILRRND